MTELVPGRKVVWTVTESALSFVQHTAEWTGTKLVFDLTPKGDKTEICFTQLGLVPEFECYGACSRGWAHLLRQLGAVIAAKAQPDRAQTTDALPGA